MLKEAMIAAPIMQAVDWGLPFEVMCDASECAMGAIWGNGMTISPMPSTM